MANNGSTSTSMKAPRIGNLSKVSDVSRELRRVYRLARTGELPTQDLSRYANVLQIMVHILRDSDLQQRIEALEEASRARP